MLDFLGLSGYLLAGVVTGSFLNIAIYRLPRVLWQQPASSLTPSFSLLWAGSHCPCCQHKLAVSDNIPLLSWLWLRGVCRYCQQTIDWCYPVTETLCGLWFVAVGYLAIQDGRFVADNMSTVQILLQQLPILLLFCLLYCICLLDLKYYLIPDVLNNLLLWCGLLFSVVGLTVIEPGQAVLSVALVWCLLSAGGCCFRLLRGYQGIGAGDIKLFAASAGWLGLQYLPLLLLLAAANGLLMWLLLRLYRHYIRWRNYGAVDIKWDNKPADELTVCLREGVNPDIHLPFGPAIALTVLLLFVLAHRPVMPFINGIFH